MTHHDGGGILLIFGLLVVFALIAIWLMPAKKPVPPEDSGRIDPPNWQSPGTDKKKAPNGYAASALLEGFPKAKVMRVIDGDTVIVAKGCAKITIRLDSIDCPEDGQYWGDTAAYGLIKLVGGRNVHLEEHGIDCHGRTLATIYVQIASGEDCINVNERMVTLGHAWVMRRFYDHLPRDRQAKLNYLENWARSKKVGLWRTQNPIPPWQWRNGSRAAKGYRSLD